MKSFIEKDAVPLPADLVPASSDRSVLVAHAVVSPAPEPDLSGSRSDLVRHKSSLRRTGKALSSSVALAPREADTLNLLARGHTYAQTAVLLGVSVSTIRPTSRRSTGNSPSRRAAPRCWKRTGAACLPRTCLRSAAEGRSAIAAT